LSKPRRTKPLHGSGADVLTPQFSDAEIAALPEHSKKGAVLFFIEGLQRRIRAQQEIIEQQQDHIDKLKRIFSEMGPLLPEHNPRPSRK